MSLTHWNRVHSSDQIKYLIKLNTFKYLKNLWLRLIINRKNHVMFDNHFGTLQWIFLLIFMNSFKAHPSITMNIETNSQAFFIIFPAQNHLRIYFEDISSYYAEGIICAKIQGVNTSQILALFSLCLLYFCRPLLGIDRWKDSTSEIILFFKRWHWCGM